MTAGLGLLIEYVGGPRDGDRSYLLRSAAQVPVIYPLEIKVFEYDLDEKVEEQVGRYVKDTMANDDEAMRYVWARAGREYAPREEAS